MSHSIQQISRPRVSIVPGSGEPSPSTPLEQSNITAVSTLATADAKRRLILTLDGKIIREIPITSRNISIGRKHDNDIQLNDLTLSGRHAQISSVPDYVFVEDLGSTNGTLVNGNHVKKVALEQGDVIQVGHHQLTFLQESENAYEPTMFVKAEFDETQFIYDDEINAQVVKGLPLGGFRTLGQPVSKTVMELRKTYNTIGFQGKRVALITRGSSGYYITSVIGTRSRRTSDIPLLNGAAISTELTLLKENDIINIAGFEVQFYFLS
jgi:hypothetical protein